MVPSRSAVKWIVWRLGFVVILLLVIYYLILSPSENLDRRNAISALKVPLLSDHDRQVRGISALSLGKIGDSGAAEPLLLAYEKDETVLAEVVQALMDLGIKPIQLNESLESDAPGPAQKVLQFIRDWLRQFTFRDALYFLLPYYLTVSIFSLIGSLLRSSRKGLSMRQRLARGARTSAGVFAALLAAGTLSYLVARQLPIPERHPDIKVSKIVVIELARKTKDNASVPWLVSILENSAESSEARWRAAQALGTIADMSGSKALENALASEDPLVRLYSAWSIGNIFAASDNKREDQLSREALDTQAERRLTEALKLRPNSGYTYLLRGRVFIDQARYGDAVADFDKAIALSPLSRGDAHIDRGYALELLGKHADAISDYNEGISLNQQNDLGYYRRGLCSLFLQDWNKAISDFSKAIELKPSFAEPFLQRARVYKKLGKADLAIADYESYLSLDRSGLDTDSVEQEAQQIKR